ncbi:MAG: lysostaphin resistance A-like protein [bacterium]
MEPVTFKERHTTQALPLGKAFFLFFLLICLEIGSAIVYQQSPSAIAVPSLLFIALQRIAGVFLIVGFLAYWGYGPDRLGLSPSLFRRGLLHGILWCCGFGALVGGVGVILHLAGVPAHRLLGSMRMQSARRLIAYVLVGCLIGPLVEDLVFIGIVYNALRKKLPLLLSIAIVVPLFAAAHGRISVSLVIQALGAILFTLSFEYSGSLLTPMIIHACGNLAILVVQLL